MESRSRLSRPFVAIGIVVVLYAVFAMAIYWPMPLFSSSQIVTCGCNDLAQQTWFLSWTHFAIDHGANPFWTSWLNYPYGVNLADNTSMPLVGVLAFPITAIAGPIAAFNFMMRFALFISALSMFFVLRTFVRSNYAAFFGGLLYGFSAYTFGQAIGHLNLLFIPFPPLIFWLLVELLGRQRWKSWVTGGLLGLACLGQFFVSTELLASCVILAAVGVVIVAALYRSEIRQHLHRALQGIGVAIGVFVVIAGYPIWYVLAGPQHLTGVAQPIEGLWAFRTDLLGLVTPTVIQRFGTGHLKAVGTSFAAGNITENGIYLGIPLLVAVVLVIVLCRHRISVRIAGAMAVVAFILSLGPALVIDRHHTHIPLPFDLLRHIPLLQSEVPARYSLFVQMFVAVVIAIGIDVALAARFSRANATQRLKLWMQWQSRYVLVALTAVVSVVVVLPLYPALSYATPVTGVPPYFTSAAVNEIPQSSVLLAYPYPVNPDNFAMLWQAADAMRFKLLGDYAIIPSANGDGTTAPPTLQPSVMQHLFNTAFVGTSASPTPLAPLNRRTMTQLRTFLIRYDVETIALDPVGVDPGLVVRYLTKALGAPRVEGGVTLWLHVPKLIVAAQGH